MQVFKTILKVMRSNLGLILMYMILFNCLSFAIGTVSSGSADISASNPKAALVNLGGEENAPLIETIKEVFKEKAKFKEMENDETVLSDALFYSDVNTVLYIPANFFGQLMAGGGEIKTESRPDSVSQVMMEMQLDRYFQVIRTYASFTELDEAEILARAGESFSALSEVEYAGGEKLARSMRFQTSLNWQVYIQLVVIPFAVVNILMAFNKRELIHRIGVSSTSPTKLSLQKYLSCAIIALAVILIEFILLASVYGATFFSAAGMLSFVFLILLVIVSLSFSFMIGSFLKNSVALSAVVNVIALTVCFFSGVFVPRFLLAPGVLIAARFTPGFWYVDAIELLSTTVTLTGEAVGTLLLNAGMLIMFAVALLLVGVVIARKKRVTRS